MADPAMTLGRQGLDRHRRLEVEQRLKAFRALRQAALLLQPDLEVGDAAAEPFVLAAHAAQGDVVAPAVADRADHGGRALLHPREGAEGDPLEHRHAGLRLHLGGDQDDVPDDNGNEQQPRAGAAGCRPLNVVEHSTGP